MTGKGRYLEIIASITCLLVIICVIGCQKTDIGPKREDHEIAHKPRYHPDINRSRTADSASSNTTTSQPFNLTPPNNLTLKSGPVGSPVLFVNGDSIAVQEILEPIIEELNQKAATLPERDYLNFVIKRANEVIRNIISTLLIYQEAKKIYNSEKAQEAIDREADRWIKLEINRRFQGVHARYEKHLKALDLTVEEMKQRARRQIMNMQFQRDRFEPLLTEPSRHQRMKFYKGNMEKFTTPAKAELFLIEIPITHSQPHQIDTERKQARKTLEQARKELEIGTDFSTVAKKYSKGIMASQGGAWNNISPGSLKGRWAKPADVLFTLQSGQISDIIETDESVFIVKCGQKTPRHQLTFEEAQGIIIEQLLDEQFVGIQKEYLQDLYSRATIQRYPEFFRAVIAAAPRPPGYQAKP